MLVIEVKALVSIELVFRAFGITVKVLISLLL